MTNDEAIEIIDSVGEGRTEEDWYKALDMGIAALENQERMQRELKSLDGIADTCDKLEKALQLSCELVPKSDWCYTKEHVCDTRGCTMCMIAYFKRKAGID